MIMLFFISLSLISVFLFPVCGISLPAHVSDFHVAEVWGSGEGGAVCPQLPI